MENYIYSFSNIVGHKEEIDFLNNLILTDRIPTGLLFYGQKDIGKRLTAFSFAAAVLCNDFHNYTGINETSLFKAKNNDVIPLRQTFKPPCGNCLSCISLLNNSNPNLIFIGTDASSINIEKINELNKSLSLKPLYNGYRFIIIDNASKMNLNAMNAILKILEEPPEKTVFILITSNINAILTTIISRCMIVKFKPISEELLLKTAGDVFKEANPDALTVYSRLSMGSFSNLEIFISGNYINLRNDILSLFFNESFYNASLAYNYNMSEKFAKILKSAEEIENKNENFMFEILLLILRDIYVYYVTKNEKLIYNIDVCDKIKDIISGGNLNAEKLSLMMELTADYINKINYNFNKVIALDSYFSHLLMNMQ